jgi:hypothetical protein
MRFRMLLLVAGLVVGIALGIGFGGPTIAWGGPTMHVTAGDGTAGGQA